jgi:hypothetical protein
MTANLEVNALCKDGKRGQSEREVGGRQFVARRRRSHRCMAASEDVESARLQPLELPRFLLF